jgi:hypothetical protein
MVRLQGLAAHAELLGQLVRGGFANLNLLSVANAGLVEGAVQEIGGLDVQGMGQLRYLREAWVAELAQGVQLSLRQASVRGEGLHSKASLSEALLDLGFKGCGHSVRWEHTGRE